MDVIVTNIGLSKLEAIKIIRDFTNAGLKDAKDFAELAEKNYCVAISDIPQESTNEVLESFASANIQAKVADKGVSIFRKLPYNPSGKEYIPAASADYRPIETKMTIHKKTDNSLRGYLKVVATMESQLWSQDRLLSKLKARESSLAHPKNIEKPQRASFDKDYDEIMIYSIVGLGFVTLYKTLRALVENGFWSALLTLVVGGILSLGIPALIFLSLGYALGGPGYKKAMIEYEAKVARDKKRVSQELKFKQEIQRQIAGVQAERQRTKQTLNALYSLSIIHASYRNLVAVSSLFDYLDKGICKRLEGRDGAYAFYEEDLRFQRIESKLDIIIQKLDQIASNQEYLASLIREGNAAMYRIEQQNNAMARTMDSISENAAVAAYNTRCCAESLAIMESISIYRYIKS